VEGVGQDAIARLPMDELVTVLPSSFDDAG